jgi:hypothetical protein
MFSLVLMSTSCEKDPVVPEPTQTLEELYPDWANLTWVATDGITAEMNPNIYPRVNISIMGDEGTFIQLPDNNFPFQIISITGNTVAFKNISILAPVTGTFTYDEGFILLYTCGVNDKNDPSKYHTYKLKINQ